MMLSILIACFVATASAANYCCSPDQWEGDIGFLMGSKTKNSSSLVEGTMSISLDEVNKIMMTNQTLNVDGYPVQQKIVGDYKNNVLYTITPTSCSKQTVGEWVSGCIPDNATEVTARYGLGSETLQVKAYHVDYINFDVYFSVTADTCVPVAEDIFGRFGEADVMQTLVYANIKPGIADRSVFSVPAQCDDAPSFTASNFPGRRSALF